MQSRSPRTPSSFNNSRGRPLLVFFCGLILGLSIAVAVGIYITHVPLPAPIANDKALNGSNNSNHAMDKLIEKHINPDNTSPNNDAPSDPNTPLYGKPSNITPPSTPTSVEMIAEQETPRPTTNSTASVPNNMPQDRGSYVLQIAAYTTAQEAEQQKAKLALQGFDAKVMTHENNGVKYFRVRLGPFDKMDEAQTAKDKLHALKIESLLIKTTLDH